MRQRSGFPSPRGARGPWSVPALAGVLGGPPELGIPCSGRGHGGGRGRAAMSGPSGGPRFGEPPFAGQGFGPGHGFFGPGHGMHPPGPGHHRRWGRRGRRMRGDVRAAVLALLAEQPGHGYALMSELARRSGGLWRPSPGSVYPVLQQLQDEGLVIAAEEAGRRVFSLTEAGRRYVDEHADEIGTPWTGEDSGSARRASALMEALGALGAAVHQVAQLADEGQSARAREILERARRTMYRILAEEGAPGAPEDAPAGGGPTSGAETSGSGLASDSGKTGEPPARPSP